MFDLEEIIKSAKIYLCAKDKSLKYIYCNENVGKSLNLSSPKKIIGKTDYNLFSSNIAHMYRSSDECILSGGIVTNIREIYPDNDKIKEILVSKNPLKNKFGAIVGIAISFIDITDLVGNSHADILQYDQQKKRYKIQLGKKTEFFTQCEYDVFKYVLKGFTAKQIARQLTWSHRTVEDYINKIKCKLQCTSKYQIIEIALRLGIFQKK